MRDVKYALRVLRRAPGFTALVTMTLALGIGANTAVFSIVHAVLLAPLPFHEPERLVAIWTREIHAKGTSKLFDLYNDYENWKADARSFEGVAGITWSPQASPGGILTGRGPARSVLAMPVTVEFFSLLGVRPLIGRTFEPADRGCNVVLSHSFWQSGLGGQKDITAQALRLDDRECTVVGVMPPGFAFLPPEAPVAMWALLPRPAQTNKLAVGVFARLRPGVSMAAAQAEVAALHHQLHQNDRWGKQTEPVVYDLHGEFTWLTGRNLRLTLIVLFAAVGFVLLICCVNAANLLMAKSVARQGEMAVRAALGSGRARLVRQLLAENLIVSLVAGIAGAGLAVAAVHYFRVTRPVEMPPGTVLQVNAPVLVFTLLLSMGTALLFGLLPAWRTAKVELNEALKAGGRGWIRSRAQRRAGKLLIVAEVMLTVLLLSGAGLLIQTVARFASAPLGLDPNGLVTASLALPSKGYAEAGRRLQFYDRVTEELIATPGLGDAALSNVRPLSGGGAQEVIEVEGHPEPLVDSLYDTFQQTVSPNYFRVLSVPLIRGRFFDRSDREGGMPAAIVNEALVRKYLGNEPPIGRHIRPFNRGSQNNPWLTIVGVVGNEKRTTVYQEMAWVDTPLLYRPVAQNPPKWAVAIVRAGPASGAVGESLRRSVAKVDAEVPVEEIQTMDAIESKILAYPRFRAALLGGFAALALILAGVGLFGVLSHAVSQRTHEIGLRMALGASRFDVLGMVLKEGLVLVAGGAVLGLAGAWMQGRYLVTLLYGARTTNVWLLVTASMVLFAVGLAAMWFPAQRASRVDPMRALKDE